MLSTYIGFSSILPWAIVLIVLVALVCRLLPSNNNKRIAYPLPPGPKGRFLVGNLGQVSSDDAAGDYIKWGKEYNSDIIHLKVLGSHMICLNSMKAATDLLDRRGANYSDRPRFTLFEVMGWGLTLTFLPWGPRFKRHRSLFQQTFAQSRIKPFQDLQLQEARKAVRSLLTQPTRDWRDATLLMSTSIIFRIAFGQEITDASSPYCAMAAAANDATTNGGIAGTSLLDVFPPARHLPSWLNPCAALKHARASKPVIQTIHDVPWDASLVDIEAGTAAPSFMRTHYEKYAANEAKGRENAITIPDLKGASCAVFIAGGNTTWSTVQSCMLFLTKYPAAQARVHAEIDAVVGEDELPSFAHRAQLPYLERFVHECLRMLPLNPLVIPHKSLKEDVYDGMRIPAGSVVFANAKAMYSNPEVYADPDVFDPDRYLRGEPYPAANFGFGRRKCPGSHLAMASVFSCLSTFMAVFSMEKRIGSDGKPIEPELGLSVGLGGHPREFECELRVRREARSRVLIEEERR